MVTAIPGLQSFCLAAALCLAAIYLLQVNTVHTNSTKYKALTKSLIMPTLNPARYLMVGYFASLSCTAYSCQY